MSLRTRIRHQWRDRWILLAVLGALGGCAGSPSRPAVICPDNPVVAELPSERVYVQLDKRLTTPPPEPAEVDVATDDVGKLWQTEKALRKWGRDLVTQLLEAGAVQGTTAPSCK